MTSSDDEHGGRTPERPSRGVRFAAATEDNDSDDEEDGRRSYAAPPRSDDEDDGRPPLPFDPTDSSQFVTDDDYSTSSEYSDSMNSVNSLTESRRPSVCCCLFLPARFALRHAA